MRTIRVNKTTLLNTVKENRKTHRNIFEKAMENYRAAAIERLDARIAELKAGKPATLTFGLLYPEDHTPDYDRVIGMLDMSLDTEIELDEREYGQYVQDDWSWRRQWESNTFAYASGQTPEVSEGTWVPAPTTGTGSTWPS